jgi:hypothetical protein
MYFEFPPEIFVSRQLLGIINLSHLRNQSDGFLNSFREVNNALYNKSIEHLLKYEEALNEESYHIINLGFHSFLDTQKKNNIPENNNPSLKKQTVFKFYNDIGMFFNSNTQKPRESEFHFYDLSDMNEIGILTLDLYSKKFEIFNASFKIMSSTNQENIMTIETLVDNIDALGIKLLSEPKPKLKNCSSDKCKIPDTYTFEYKPVFVNLKRYQY